MRRIEQQDKELRLKQEEQAPQKADEVPASYEDYQISFPDGELKADPEINKRLHEAGFTNAQAQLVYDLAREKMLPLAEQVADELNSNRALAELIRHYGGEGRWQTVSKQIEAWGKQNLPEAVYEALCRSAQGVLAMDKLMRAQEPKTLPKAGRRSEDLNK